jgi:hypothetical protein
MIHYRYLPCYLFVSLKYQPPFFLYMICANRYMTCEVLAYCQPIQSPNFALQKIVRKNSPSLIERKTFKMKKRVSELIFVLFFFLFYSTVFSQVTNTESFETAIPPSGWSSAIGSGSYNWTRTTTSGLPDGSYFAYYNSNSATAGSWATLSTSAIDFSARGSSTPTLSFYMYRGNLNTANIDYLEVYINTSNNLTGATLLTNSLGYNQMRRPYNQAPTATANTWVRYSYDIPATFNSSTNYILFKAVSAKGDYISIDLVSWISYPPPITTYPYKQDFESGSLPNGWTSTGGSIHWVQNTWNGSSWANAGSDGLPVTLDGMPTPSTSAGTKGPTSGTHCIWLNENGIGSNETEYLVSPVFDLSSMVSAGGRPNLRFYYACGGTTAPTLTIQGSSDGGTTWGSDWPTGYLQCLTNSGSFGGGTTEWLLENIPFPAAYQGSNVRIRIKTVTAWVQPDLWIDDLAVENIGCSFDCVNSPLLPSGWSKFPVASGWANELYDGVTICPVHGVAHGNNYLPPSAKNLMVTSSSGAVWLFSPGLSFTGGVSYSFQFIYGMDPGSTGDIEVKVGTSASVAGMTAGTAVYSDASISGTVMSCRMGSFTFTPATTGVYYIGWQAKTISGGGNIYLDNLGFGNFSDLPVELETFTAKCDHGNNIDITWATASEVNNDYFTLESSTDGIHYNTVTTVSGAGNSNKELIYQYTHENISAGTVYYKLKQTDFDGKFEYFGPVAVNCDDEAATSIDIYPNPATDQFIIALINLKNVTCKIEIFNSMGQPVLSDSISPGANYSTDIIDISELAEGIYLIKIVSGTGMADRNFKLIKK